ncbi:MAG TPA: cytochrome b562 [Chthoniobacteraceae bacterium]|jgi:hypothetical protein|nr:cytochrome b562 [Chthoniobacteraceae bacterium]
MKLKTLLTLLITAAFSTQVAFAAEEDSALAKEMKTMNKSLRTLKRQIADPAKKEDNLALLATIKKTIEASHKLDPAKIKDVPEAERAAYKQKYNAQLDDLDKTFDEVAAALKAGNEADAKKAFDKLTEQKEKGHKDFGADDE